MLELQGFRDDHAAEIRTAFDRLTRGWPGGWCRDVYILRMDRYIAFEIAGWSRPKIIEPYTNDLLAFMERYWSAAR